MTDLEWTVGEHADQGDPLRVDTATGKLVPGSPSDDGLVGFAQLSLRPGQVVRWDPRDGLIKPITMTTDDQRRAARGLPVSSVVIDEAQEWGYGIRVIAEVDLEAVDDLRWTVRTRGAIPLSTRARTCLEAAALDVRRELEETEARRRAWLGQLAKLESAIAAQRGSTSSARRMLGVVDR